MRRSTFCSCSCAFSGESEAEQQQRENAQEQEQNVLQLLMAQQVQRRHVKKAQGGKMHDLRLVAPNQMNDDWQQRRAGAEQQIR
jgi:hypothetical protein